MERHDRAFRACESCKEEDGSIYLGPISTAAFACSGMFWNEELFAQAGIETFPETWEEFWQCCEQLESCRHHTTGTSYGGDGVGANADRHRGSQPPHEEGAGFYAAVLSGELIRTQAGCVSRKLLQKLVSIYNRGRTVYRDFDVAYENFFSGQAAMIPNGYWMMDQIPEEWQDKVRFAAFPGEQADLLAGDISAGQSSPSYSEEVKEGAAALLKLRTKLNMEQREELFTGTSEEMIPAQADYIEVYKHNPELVPNYQVKWNSILQEETLGEILPDLASGKITPEEFTKKEDESIQQFLEEQ